MLGVWKYCHGYLSICLIESRSTLVEKQQPLPEAVCHRLLCIFHDDVIKWKHFPRYWPFVRGIHRSPVNSPHKGQWRGALMFSLICVWINGWVNNSEAGDLRRQYGHYDVIVMISGNLPKTWISTFFMTRWAIQLLVQFICIHMLFSPSPCSLVGAHWGRDKIVAISQITFSNAFSCTKVYKFRLRFHWSLFQRIQLAIFQHWFR